MMLNLLSGTDNEWISYFFSLFIFLYVFFASDVLYTVFHKKGTTYFRLSFSHFLVDFYN